MTCVVAAATLLFYLYRLTAAMDACAKMYARWGARKRQQHHSSIPADDEDNIDIELGPSKRCNSPFTSLRCLLQVYAFLAIIPAHLSSDSCTFVVRWWRLLQVFLVMAALLAAKTYCNMHLNDFIDESVGFFVATIYTIFIPDILDVQNLGSDGLTG